MITKKTYMRSATIYLVTAIVFLAFCVSRVGFVANSVKHIAHSSVTQQTHKDLKFVNDTSTSLLFNELLCEEVADEETEEGQSNSSFDVSISTPNSVKETSSKKVVYYSQDNTYAAPVGLYTLFCTWEI
jgi:hypothetical protein